MPEFWKEKFGFVCNEIEADVSFSDKALDSFFSPNGPLAHAQELAAEIFKVEHALFTTCGTTVSNRIVLDALGGPGTRILIDGASHQSVLFSATTLGMETTIIAPKTHGACNIPDLAELVSVLKTSYDEQRPFDVVVLTASSYDGYLVNMDEMLPRLIDASPTTSVLIDAAWSAIHMFSEDLRFASPFDVVNRLRNEGRDLPSIIVTTSIHKTMCSLRQGSIILVANDDNCINSMRTSLFMNHSTSPSWPILGSIDLACTHASQFGNQMVSAAIALRQYFINELRDDPVLAKLLLADYDHFETVSTLQQDPLKVIIDTSSLGKPAEVRNRLFSEYGIYVSRCNGAGMLLNFTIGVSREDVDNLLNALSEISMQRSSNIQLERFPTPGTVSSEFVIAYPPGNIIVKPGDNWSTSQMNMLDFEISAGAEIFRISNKHNERKYV